MREGTAKFADTTGENDRHLQKAFQKQVNSHLIVEFHTNFINRTIFLYIFLQFETEYAY